MSLRTKDGFHALFTTDLVKGPNKNSVQCQTCRAVSNMQVSIKYAGQSQICRSISNMQVSIKHVG